MIESGVLLGARQQPSPNYDSRAPDASISLIVIHCISLPAKNLDSVQDIDALFCNRLDPNKHPDYPEIADKKVSSHLLIDRVGNITQYVNLNDRAWHAGLSNFEGVSACNDFSIGIELVGYPDILYTGAQYGILAEVVRELMRVYPAITTKRITGHEHIAPGRKEDPGPAFDWAYFHSLLTTEPV